MELTALLVLEIVAALLVGLVLSYGVHTFIDDLTHSEMFAVLVSIVAFGAGIYFWAWLLGLAASATLLAGGVLGVRWLRKRFSLEARNARRIAALRAEVERRQYLEKQAADIARLEARVAELDEMELRVLQGQEAKEFDALLRGPKPETSGAESFRFGWKG